jgi:hypothetical protein
MKKNNSRDYETIRKTATEVINGSRQIHRLIPKAEKGRIEGGRRNVEASILLGTSERTDLSDTSEFQALIQEQILENYAKYENSWFDYEFIKTNWDRIDNKNSAEAEVYLERNGKYVNKVFHYINSDTPLEFLDNRISLHNALFPDTKYELLGFTKTIKGFAFILKQAFIKGRETNKEDNLIRFMQEAGFIKNGYNRYCNDVIEIEDLHGGNVLKGEDGHFYFIDTIPGIRDKSIYLDFKITEGK